MRDAYYLISQPRCSLEQSLAGVLVHDQSTGLRRDRAHCGGLGGRGPVKPRRHRCLWWNTAHSGVCLGLQGGRTQRSGRARLDWRAGIVIRRGVPLPLGPTLLTGLGGENHRPRHTVATTQAKTGQAHHPTHNRRLSSQAQLKTLAKTSSFIASYQQRVLKTLYIQRKASYTLTDS